MYKRAGGVTCPFVFKTIKTYYFYSSNSLNFNDNTKDTFKHL